MNKLCDILLKRWEDKRLAHFYLIKPHSKTLDPHESLDIWIKNFLTQFIKKEKNLTSYEKASNQLEMGHPDILIVDKKDRSKKYKIKDGDFDEFMKFQQYHPLEFSWRFAIVYDSHQIGKIMANKLLKTLEEPQERTTIFFLNPTGSKLLSTIESRAIELNLPPDSKETNNNFDLKSNAEFIGWAESSDYSKELKKLILAWANRSSSAYSIMDKFKSKKELQDEALLMLIEWESLHLSSTKHKNDFLHNLKWFKESKTFHNAPLERLYALLNQQLPY